MTRRMQKELTTQFVDHLCAEGFRPTVDSEEGGRITYVRFEEDGVSFAIESFLPSAADFRTVLPRALEAIQLATDQFFTNLRARMAQG